MVTTNVGSRYHDRPNDIPSMVTIFQLQEYAFVFNYLSQYLQSIRYCNSITFQSNPHVLTSFDDNNIVSILIRPMRHCVYFYQKQENVSREYCAFDTTTVVCIRILVETHTTYPSEKSACSKLK